MKVVVIGYGSIGSRHAHILRDMGHEVVIVDVSEEKRVKAEKEGFVLYSITPVDAAFICTPPGSHLDNIKTWLGRVNLFVEKPLINYTNFTRLDHLKELTRANQNSMKVDMVACNMRFDPLIQRAGEMLRYGRIGKLISVKVDFGYDLASWRPGVDLTTIEHPGVVLDCIHELDLLTWLHGYVKKKKIYTNYSSTIESMVMMMDAILLFDDGMVANVHFDYHRKQKRRRIEWLGKKGTIVYMERGSLKNPELGSALYLDDELISEEENTNTPYMEQFKHFFYCIDHGFKTCNSISDAIGVMELAFDLHREFDDV